MRIDEAEGGIACDRDAPAGRRQARDCHRYSRQTSRLSNRSDGVEIDRIQYNAARADYSVYLRFNDIAQFEAFKAALASRGYAAAEAGGVVRSGAFYRGQLRVSLS